MSDASGVNGKKRPSPGTQTGGILHQRRNLPFSPTYMAIAGLAIVGGIAYLTLYANKKPRYTGGDVARVTANVSDPPRK